ncbi:trichohyalin-like, partial [Clupea harengus]|uniref:Trichohyalin-like n=1 Tax=Clupea harengus TaxID=7950 RepID=A0A8M1KLL0_CLUHA
METEGKEAGHQDVYERHQDGVPLETMSIRQQANAHKKFQPKEQEMRDTYESLVSAFMAHLEAHSGHCEVTAQDTLPRFTSDQHTHYQMGGNIQKGNHLVMEFFNGKSLQGYSRAKVESDPFMRMEMNKWRAEIERKREMERERMELERKAKKVDRQEKEVKLMRDEILRKEEVVRRRAAMERERQAIERNRQEIEKVRVEAKQKRETQEKMIEQMERTLAEIVRIWRDKELPMDQKKKQTKNEKEHAWLLERRSAEMERYKEMERERQTIERRQNIE